MSNQVAKPLNWSLTSQDYGTHRLGYPESFFRLLQPLGIGLSSQNILDIGAGTGNLAIPFARQGCRVTAVDISDGQIAAAREKAERDGLAIEFIVSPAEDAPVKAGEFHAVTASMCWGYLDKPRIVERVKTALREDGLLLICSIIWQSGDSDITGTTEELIGRYNKDHGDRGARRDHDDIYPEWARDDFSLKTFHTYEEKLAFTRESWRGRIRASKWIGAALPPEQVQNFDRDLAAALEKTAPETFEITHTISLRIFQR